MPLFLSRATVLGNRIVPVQFHLTGLTGVAHVT